MAQLNVQLLGNFRLTYDHEELTAAFPPRLQALLAFILLHDEAPLARNAIAFRFWPDVPEKKARNNLRQLLYRLRESLPRPERFLNSEGSTVGWRSDAPATVDLHRFESGLGAATTVSEVEEALALYGGPLLPDHYDEWLLPQRERLQQEFISGLERLATMLEQKGEYETAATQLRRLLAVESLRESSYLRLMRLHARLRDPAGLERVYQECVDLLDAELGVGPSPNLQQSYEKLTRVAAGTDRLVRLPPQPTPLFGREWELLEIGERLQDPQCRLLTLVGPGGIGKTRLAIEAARAAAVDFGDGAVFVSLAGLASSEYLVSTLAAALKVSFREREPAERQLLEHLADREILLLLDNYEHLLPETGLIQRILAQAPGVQLLVTSRERLRLRWEWLMDVEGLALPEENGAAANETGAVRLLHHHLRRLKDDFTPADGDLPAVRRIARLTGGMPLALELAAATARVFSLSQLAGRLAESADVLTLSHRDVPKRHRSVRAAFDHSWRLLTAREQEVLARLSVFRSSFDLEAAAAVAGQGATPPVLAALVDKSLLQRESVESGDVRLSWHELLRQYAAENLDERPEIREESLVRHARHYSTRVEAVQGGASITPELFRMFAAEIDNVRLSWQTAVRLADHVLLGQLVVGLAAYQHLNGLGEESHHMFESAAAALRSVVYPLSGSTPAQQIALGKVLTWQASFVSNQDREIVENAWRLADEALQLLEPVDTALERATALFFRGYARYCLNQTEEAIPDCQQAATVFERVGEKFYLAIAFNVLAMSHQHLGKLDTAERYGRQMLGLAREIGISSLVSLGFRNLANYLRLQESYAEAEQYAVKAYELALRDGDEIDAVRAQYRAAEIAYDRHHFQEARELLLEASKTEGLRQKALAQWYRLMNLLGRVAVALGESEEARHYLCKALETYPSLRFDAVVLQDVLLTIADWLQGDRPGRAVELLALVSGHPECEAIARREAQERLARLATRLSGDVMAEAQIRGEALSLEETVAQLKVELIQAAN